MKKTNRIKTTLWTACMLTAVSYSAQTISYNFENWTGNEPNGWSTNNATPGSTQTTFKQVVNPAQGTASVKLVTAACPSCPVFASNPLAGVVILGPTGEGIPFTQRPLSIDFKYKSNPLSGDMSGFFVELTKWNTATQQTDIIGEAWFISQINVSTWTSVNLPISYSSGNIPDTLYISAFSSLGNSNFPVPTIPNPVSGSEFYIDAITINLPSCAGLSVSASGTNETAPLAANGTASVTASGGTTPYSYLWSNGATSASINNLSNGVYNVTVTDANGCSKVTSYNVLAGGCNGLSVVATGTNATSFTSNNGMATATATGGTPPYTYLWNNGATTASISNLDVGAYIVSVTDNTSNCTQFAYVTVYAGSNPVGVREVTNDNSSTTIYPNPGSGMFNVTSEKKFDKIQVINFLGKSVYDSEVESNHAAIDLQLQPQGIYFVNLIDAGKIISTKKLVVVN